MKNICYSIKHLTPVQRTNLQRELYGFKDISNKGQYVYKRQGLINSKNHRKVYFTALIVKDKIADKVIEILKKHGAKFHVMLVEN